METSLDVDMVSAACPACRINLVEAASSVDTDLSDAVAYAVRGTRYAVRAQRAKIVSMAAGIGAESADDPTRLGAVYNTPGVPFLAASGDAGNEGSQGLPASHPNVIAVGGTSVSRVGRGFRSRAWEGAGSFCSQIFARPAFQRTIHTGCPKTRAVADISGTADPALNSSVAIYDSRAEPGVTSNPGEPSYALHGWHYAGGTSFATPFLAGMIARQNAGGVITPAWIYAHGNRFHHITTGDNGVCGQAAAA